MKAYIGYVKKNGSIKCVQLKNNNELDEVGYNLIEYFTTLIETKKLVKTTLDYIDEDTFKFSHEVGDEDDEDEDPEDRNEYFVYEDTDDLIQDRYNFTYYYLFKDDKWLVLKPNSDEFLELETVLEEEF